MGKKLKNSCKFLPNHLNHIWQAELKRASACSKAIRVSSQLIAYLRRKATSYRGLRAMMNHPADG